MAKTNKSEKKKTIIKTTTGKVYNAIPALQELMREKLEAKAAYWLSKLYRKVATEYEDIEKQRNELVKEYALEQKPNESEKQTVKLDPKRKDEFQEKYQELMGIEIELDVKKIDWDSLVNIKMAAQDVLALDEFIEGLPK